MPHLFMVWVLTNETVYKKLFVLKESQKIQPGKSTSHFSKIDLNFKMLLFFLLKTGCRENFKTIENDLIR